MSVSSQEIPRENPRENPAEKADETPNPMLDIVGFAHRSSFMSSGEKHAMLEEDQIVNGLISDLLANRDVVMGCGLSLIEEYAHILLRNASDFQAVYSGLYSVLSGEESQPSSTYQQKTDTIMNWAARLHLMPQLTTTITSLFCTAPGFQVDKSGALLHQFVGFLTQILSKINDSRAIMGRIASAMSLYKLERHFPGLLTHALGELYTLAEKENSFAREHYISLLLLVLEHSIAAVAWKAQVASENLMGVRTEETLDEILPIFNNKGTGGFQVAEATIKAASMIKYDQLELTKDVRIGTGETTLIHNVRRCFSLFTGSSGVHFTDVLFSSWITAVARIARTAEIPTSEFHILNSLLYTSSPTHMHTYFILSDLFPVLETDARNLAIARFFHVSEEKDLRIRLQHVLRDYGYTDQSKMLMIQWLSQAKPPHVGGLFGALLPTPFDTILLLNAKLAAVPAIRRRSPVLSSLDYFTLLTNVDVFLTLPPHSTVSRMYFENVLRYLKEGLEEGLREGRPAGEERPAGEPRGGGSGVQVVWKELSRILAEEPRFMYQILGAINTKLLCAYGSPTAASDTSASDATAKAGKFILVEMLRETLRLEPRELPTFFPLLANVAELDHLDHLELAEDAESVRTHICRALFRYVSAFEANAEVLEICRKMLHKIQETNSGSQQQQQLSQLLLACSRRSSDIGIRGRANFLLNRMLHLPGVAPGVVPGVPAGAVSTGVVPVAEEALPYLPAANDVPSVLDRITKVFAMDRKRVATIYKSTGRFLALEKRPKDPKEPKEPQEAQETAHDTPPATFGSQNIEDYLRFLEAENAEERYFDVDFSFSYSSSEEGQRSGEGDAGDEQEEESNSQLDSLYSIEVFFGENPFYHPVPPILVPYLCRYITDDGAEKGSDDGGAEIAMQFPYSYDVSLKLRPKYPLPAEFECYAKFNSPDGVSYMSELGCVEIDFIDIACRLRFEQHTQDTQKQYSERVSVIFDSLWEWCANGKDGAQSSFSIQQQSQQRPLEAMVDALDTTFSTWKLPGEPRYAMFVPPRNHILMKRSEIRDEGYVVLDICTDFWLLLPHLRELLRGIVQ